MFYNRNLYESFHCEDATAYSTYSDPELSKEYEKIKSKYKELNSKKYRILNKITDRTIYIRNSKMDSVDLQGDYSSRETQLYRIAKIMPQIEKLKIKIGNIMPHMERYWGTLAERQKKFRKDTKNLVDRIEFKDNDE